MQVKQLRSRSALACNLVLPLRAFGLLAVSIALYMPTAVLALDAQVVARGKAATALIDRGDLGSGSGFCIQAGGLFLTNRHVVDELPLGSIVKVVLRPSEPTQLVVDARLVKVSKDYDLALLKVDQPLKVKPLELGAVGKLIETTPITALGYPFGKMLAMDPKGYPNISVNTGKISSLRKKDGKLEAIQLDASVNPGNSGGPVVDEQGRVVGVIVRGIPGSGINFAIPVSHVKTFLSRPGLMLASGQLDFVDRHRQRPFDIEVIGVGKRVPLKEVEVRLGGEEAGRTFTAKAAGDRYRVMATALDPASTPLELVLVGKIDGKRSHLSLNDQAIQIGGRSVRLSTIRTLKISDGTGQAELSDETTVKGKVTGLPKSAAKQLNASSDVYVFAIDVPTGVPYTLKAKTPDGKTVESVGTLEFNERPAELVGSWIDVNAIAETKPDVERGQWELSDGELQLKSSKGGIIQLPVSPAGDYDLKAEFTLSEGGEFQLTLPLETRACFFGLNKKQVGVGPGFRTPNYGKKVKRPKFGQKQTLEVSVRSRSRFATVTIVIDGGEPIRYWGYPPDQASLPSDLHKVVATRALTLTGIGQTVTFHNINLKMLRGKVAFHRHGVDSASVKGGMIRRYQWVKRPGTIPMTPVKETFGILGGVTGGFRGAAESVWLSQTEDGRWQLNGKSRQPFLAGVGLSVRHPLRSAFEDEVKEVIWRARDKPIKLIHKNDGFPLLSGVWGTFAGGGERVGVTLNEDGYWYLGGKSGQRTLGARALVYKFRKPGQFKAKIERHEWTRGKPPVQMIHRDKGICVLALVAGAYWTGMEGVDIFTASDGYWYLRGNARRAIRGEVISIEFLNK